MTFYKLAELVIAILSSTDLQTITIGDFTSHEEGELAYLEECCRCDRCKRLYRHSAPFCGTPRKPHARTGVPPTNRPRSVAENACRPLCARRSLAVRVDYTRSKHDLRANQQLGR